MLRWHRFFVGFAKKHSFGNRASKCKGNGQISSQFLAKCRKSVEPVFLKSLMAVKIGLKGNPFLSFLKKDAVKYGLQRKTIP
jgi:hypothetical protein